MEDRTTEVERERERGSKRQAKTETERRRDAWTKRSRNQNKENAVRDWFRDGGREEETERRKTKRGLMCIPVFTVVLFTTAETWKQPVHRQMHG